MRLRPYQLAALETSKKKLESGVTRQLIALPTGTGKTPLFASVPSFFGFKGRVMVLVHMEELATQAADKMKTWNPGAVVGIEMADRVAPANAQIVIGSVPTLGREGSLRLAKFNPAEFDAIVCDEAHHSTSQSYKNVFNHFGLFDAGNKKLLLGVTATPNRGDGIPLAEVYEEITYQMTVLDAIRQGWLVDMTGVRIRTGASLDGVHTRAGDFATGELAAEVNTPQRNDLIVRSWIEKAKERQTVVFTVDIAHAKALAETFRRYGIGAEAIWGDDPDRQAKLREHRAGNLKVLCNCAVLTEGYDDPAIGCIVLARPTKSSLLFTQMIGRGTRLQPNIQNLKEAKAAGIAITKEDCLLMDVVDNTTKHSLVTLSTIFGLGSKLDLNGAKASYVVDAMDKAKKEHPDLDFDKLTDFKKLESFAETVNLFEVKFPEPVLNHSLLQWHPNTSKDAFVLLLPEGESVTICKDLLETYHVIGTVAGNSFKTGLGKDIAEAFRYADTMVTTFGKHLLHLLKRESKWHADPATPKQIGFLKRVKVPIPDGLSKGDAAKKISQYMAKNGRPWYMNKKGVAA